MRRFLTSALLALGLAVLWPAGAALAQSCGGIEEPACPPEHSRVDPVAPGPALNTGSTRIIVRLLEGANDTCDDDRIELRYRIDCLRLYYLKVAELLPDNGDYLPVKKAMLDAAARLDAIVTANLDTTAPAIRPREKHKPAAKRMPPIRAVTEESAAQAAAEAAKVVEETELIIIRSGGDPARRTQHYTDIAAAVEENLVILRSA